MRLSNNASLLTTDPPRVESLLTIPPSTQNSEHALGQAWDDLDVGQMSHEKR